MLKMLKNILAGQISLPIPRSTFKAPKAQDPLPSHNDGKKSFFNKNKYLSVFDLFQLIIQWENIVGASLAKKTTPLKIYRQSLIILVPHPSWAQELSFLSTPIIQKIYTHFPSAQHALKGLSFQYSPQWKPLLEQFPHLKNRLMNAQIEHRAPTSYSPLHPQSPYYQTRLRQGEELFCELKDKELKDGLIKLYIQLHLEPRTPSHE
jgi:hypothetical protein